MIEDDNAAAISDADRDTKLCLFHSSVYFQQRSRNRCIYQHSLEIAVRAVLGRVSARIRNGNALIEG